MPWVVMGITKTILAELLACTHIVQVYVESNAPGAVLPPAIDGLTRLDIGLNLVNPIPDLVLDDDTLTATLSFGGQPFATTVPWDAVRGMMTPDVHVGFVPKTAGDRPTKDDSEVRPKVPPTLRLV